MRAFLSILLLSVFGGGQAAAQSAIAQSQYRFHEISQYGRIEPQSFIRDSTGSLYFVYISQFSAGQWDLAIARSTSGGKLWNLTWQTAFASNASGDFGNYEPTLAVDGNDNLHCAWTHRPQQNQNGQTIQYNRFDAATQKWGAEVAIASPPSRYTRNAALGVDSKNHVYLVHAHASTGRATLFKSDKPFASDLKFTGVSPAFSGPTVYQLSLVVDSLDQVHVAYYGGSLSIYHHCFTGTSWTAQALLGNADACADWPVRLCADMNGNVYAFYGVDTQAAWDKTQWNPFWEVRKWDGATQSWGQPAKVYGTTRTQYRYQGNDVNNAWVISAACDEASGQVYLIYRDFDHGRYLLARWNDGEPAPTTYAQLNTTGSLAPNYPNRFYTPQMRGSVFPAGNRTVQGLDVLYTVADELATPPLYQLVYDFFPTASLYSTSKPKIGTTYTLELVAPGDGGMGYQAALGLSGTSNLVPIDRRYLPVTPDPFFYITVSNVLPAVFINFGGTLDATGKGQAKVVIPALPVLAGIAVHGTFVTYPGGPVGVKTISNAWPFTIEK